MNQEKNEKSYDEYVHDFAELANYFRLIANPEVFLNKIKKIVSCEKYSHEQKLVLIKFEYINTSKNISKTERHFQKLCKKLESNVINFKYKDGKNLATLTAEYISKTDNDFLLDRYYKLFNQFTKQGVDPMQKDNKKLNSFDYIFWAKPCLNKTHTLAHLKEKQELTK